MSSRNTAGFTLMEVVVTIAIIGILTAIAIPNYLSYRPKQQLNRAVNEYHSLLQNARLMAIKNRGNCTITFAASSYSITCSNSDYNKTVDLSDYGGYVEFRRPDGSAGAPGVTITFNSRGTCNTGYLHFTSTDRQQFYRVGPLISGVIRKDSYAGGGDWKAL